MIVTCEGCQRRFQVDDSRIPARGARMRCKRCNHRFFVQPEGAAADAAPSADEATHEQTLSGATLPPDSEELRFVTEPTAEAQASEPEPPSPDDDVDELDARDRWSPDDAIGEGSWEFGDTDLSFDGEAAAEAAAAEAAEPARAEPAAAEEAPPEQPWAETSQAFVDAIPEEPDAAPEGSAEPEPPPQPAETTAAAPPPASERREESTLRPVAPVAGSEAAEFEMAEDDGSAPLQLEGDAEPEPEAEAEPAPPNRAPAAEAEPAEPADSAVSAASDASAGSVPAEPGPPTDAEPTPEPAAAFDAEAVGDPFDFSDDDDEEDPDWPEAGEASTEPPAPVVAAAGRSRLAALGHASWALPLALLAAVLHGTISIGPSAAPVPAGEVALGAIHAENVHGRFVENHRSGTLFIVSGELHNRGGGTTAPGRAFQVVLLDAMGQAVGPAVPVGPILPEAVVRERSVEEIAARQAERAGQLAEMPPGGRVGFDAVWAGRPEQAVRFRLEPAGAAGPRG